MNVSSIQAAITFDLDVQIVFTLGERLKQAQNDYKATLQLLNVPEGVPPEAPRIMLSASNFRVHIGFNRADIFISVPDHINSNIDSCLDYCYSTTIGLYKMLLNSVTKYSWCGVITTLNYPCKNKTQPSIKALENLVPCITKIDVKGRELASLNFQIGFKEPPYFKHISLDGYEVSQVQFPFPAIQGISPQEKIEESGISIFLDINNILQEPKGSFEDDFSGIIEKNKNSSKSVIDELNLRGVIDG
jgi:hypothetical protein